MDRNGGLVVILHPGCGSRLARASWIEIPTASCCSHTFSCRGSQEPRGSKLSWVCCSVYGTVSRLARASWIEIFADADGHIYQKTVEARKSLVDRNFSTQRDFRNMQSRGSQEPRGSKFVCFIRVSVVFVSRLARASWIEIFQPDGGCKL